MHARDTDAGRGSRPDGSRSTSGKARGAASAAGWILLSLAAGAIGSRFLPDAWYASLRKPAWNPPSWVFGPVWTTLYVLMGLAAWRLSRIAVPRVRKVAQGLFLVPLAANAGWTWLFFGLRRPDLALADIAVLWALIAALIGVAWPRDRAAAWMLAPYLAWVTYASTLNAAVWVLNR